MRWVVVALLGTVLSSPLQGEPEEAAEPPKLTRDHLAWSEVEMRANLARHLLRWQKDPAFRFQCEAIEDNDRSAKHRKNGGRLYPNSEDLRILIKWFDAAYRVCSRCDGDIEAHCGRVEKHRQRIRRMMTNRGDHPDGRAEASMATLVAHLEERLPVYRQLKQNAPREKCSSHKYEHDPSMTAPLEAHPVLRGHYSAAFRLMMQSMYYCSKSSVPFLEAALEEARAGME